MRTVHAPMKVALPVLDIKTEFAKDDSEAAAAESTIQVKVGTEEVPSTPEEAADEALVEAFDREQQDSLPTKEELDARNEAIAIMDEKAKPKSRKKVTAAKKAKTPAKKKKVSVVAGTAKAVEAGPETKEPVKAPDTPAVTDEVDSAFEGMDEVMDDIDSSKRCMPS